MSRDIFFDYFKHSPFQVAASLSASISGVAVAWPKIDFFNIVVTFVLLYFFILWTSVVFWVWRDTQDRLKERQQRRLVVLLIILFNVPGLLIYLLLRPPTFGEVERARLEGELLRLELERLKKSK